MELVTIVEIHGREKHPIAIRLLGVVKGILRTAILQCAQVKALNRTVAAAHSSLLIPCLYTSHFRVTRSEKFIHHSCGSSAFLSHCQFFTPA